MFVEKVRGVRVVREVRVIDLAVKDVGYNDNTIKSQFSVHPIAGNVNVSVGKYDVHNTEPLPRSKKK